MLTKLQKHLKLLAAGFVLSAGLVTATVQQPVQAAPIDVLDKCTGSKSAVCAGREEEKNSLSSLIQNVINLLITIGAVIAVIMIVIGGIRYTTSAGDAGQTKSARDTIIYAVAGLVVAIMAFAIVNFVLSRL